MDVSLSSQPDSIEPILSVEPSSTMNLVDLWWQRYWGGGGFGRSILAECPRLKCIIDLVQSPARWGKFQILLLTWRAGWARPWHPSQPFSEAVGEACRILNLVQGTGTFWTLSIRETSYYLVGKGPICNVQQTEIEGHGIKLKKIMKEITDELCSCRAEMGLFRRRRDQNKGTEMGQCSGREWCGRVKEQTGKYVGPGTWRAFHSY